MTRHSGRHFLQIPGPTNVPDRILRAIDRPTMDHRGPDFGALAREVLLGLRSIFKTAGPVVIYPASGTGAWEAALVNTLSPGDRGGQLRHIEPDFAAIIVPGLHLAFVDRQRVTLSGQTIIGEDAKRDLGVCDPVSTPN